MINMPGHPIISGEKVIMGTHGITLLLTHLQHENQEAAHCCQIQVFVDGQIKLSHQALCLLGCRVLFTEVLDSRINTSEWRAPEGWKPETPAPITGIMAQTITS